jgi:hypothetical protein
MSIKSHFEMSGYRKAGLRGLALEIAMYRGVWAYYWVAMGMGKSSGDQMLCICTTMA